MKAGEKGRGVGSGAYDMKGMEGIMTLERARARPIERVGGE